MKKDVNKAKLELAQQDILQVITFYRNALTQHYALVKLKTDNLIFNRLGLNQEV